MNLTAEMFKENIFTLNFNKSRLIPANQTGLPEPEEDLEKKGRVMSLHMKKIIINDNKRTF